MNEFIKIPAYLISNFENGDMSKFQKYEGDTLYSIARSLGVDLKTLIAVNGIKNPNLILPGQPIIY